YLFEISTWKETFNSYPVSSLYQEAFSIFESKFDDTLRISCSLSLAALSENLIKPLQSKSILDWECIEIKSQSISINLEVWKDRLQKKKFDRLRISNLIDGFQRYLDITYKHDVELSRWLSHGHIGLNLIFCVYGKCLYTVALDDKNKNPDREANKITKNKDMRFSLSSKSWIQNHLENTNDFPIKCFHLLIG
ncbi:hypothetical protein VB714_21065, partial [Spirulina sp. 06S082]